MDKWLLKNKEEYKELKKIYLDLNPGSASYQAGPQNYPCIAVVAYAGGGCDEIDFIYPTMVYFGHGALTIKGGIDG